MIRESLHGTNTQRISFGKHKGEDPASVPSSYLRWLQSTDDFYDRYPELMEEVDEEIRIRDMNNDHWDE